MHEVLVNRLGGLSLPRKSVVRLTDCPDMTLDVYRGRKTTKQQQPIKESSYYVYKSYCESDMYINRFGIHYLGLFCSLCVLLLVEI